MRIVYLIDLKSFVTVYHLEIWDSERTKPTPTPKKIRFNVNMKPFKVTEVDSTSGTTVLAEASSYPTVEPGDTIKAEFRCTGTSIQVYAQNIFLFSTSSFHGDGEDVRPYQVHYTVGSGVDLTSITLKYSKFCETRA